MATSRKGECTLKNLKNITYSLKLLVLIPCGFWTCVCKMALAKELSLVLTNIWLCQEFINTPDVKSVCSTRLKRPARNWNWVIDGKPINMSSEKRLYLYSVSLPCFYFFVFFCYYHVLVRIKDMIQTKKRSLSRFKTIIKLIMRDLVKFSCV